MQIHKPVCDQEKTWQSRTHPPPSNILPLFVCISYSGNSQRLFICVGVLGTHLTGKIVVSGDIQGPNLSCGGWSPPTHPVAVSWGIVPPIGSVCGVLQSWPGWLRVPSFLSRMGFVPVNRHAANTLSLRGSVSVTVQGAAEGLNTEGTVQHKQTFSLRFDYSNGNN